MKRAGGPSSYTKHQAMGCSHLHTLDMFSPQKQGHAKKRNRYQVPITQGYCYVILHPPGIPSITTKPRYKHTQNRNQLGHFFKTSHLAGGGSKDVQTLGFLPRPPFQHVEQNNVLVLLKGKFILALLKDLKGPWGNMFLHFLWFF